MFLGLLGGVGLRLPEIQGLTKEARTPHPGLSFFDLH
jgi:hypothetical protein